MTVLTGLRVNEGVTTYRFNSLLLFLLILAQVTYGYKHHQYTPFTHSSLYLSFLDYFRTH